MRRVILGAAVIALSLSAGATRAKAQANFSDPFYLYYGWYLPRQQVLANQPGPEIGILANQAARQEAILTDRASLYAPIRGIGEEELNSTTPFSGRTGRSGVPRFSPSGSSAMNLTGRGPKSHYNRVASYYPGLPASSARGAVARRSSLGRSTGMGIGTGAGMGGLNGLPGATTRGMGGMGMGGMGMGGMGMGGFN